ncbi:MAG: YifB family Mg chelatase-like AAA ATPase [Lautropia sp.]|nr:YifB family Mg chelatase-like AAA ATPase [Lautropia sp.]
MNTLAVVHSRALFGLSAPPVSVEVHLANGLPAFHIVGLPETSVRESRERVRAALQQSGLDFPNRRITVNLAPADLPKESGRFDLPIAIGIAAAAGHLPLRALADVELVGELSLSGELRPIRAALAVAAGIVQHDPKRALILPRANVAEARPVGLARLHAAQHLREVIGHLKGTHPLPTDAESRHRPGPHDTDIATPGLLDDDDTLDMADVIGQPLARRALEIAAAGRHPLLFSGSPGTGKSLLAHRLAGLLPPLSHEQALAVAMIHAAAGQPETPSQRPRTRSPHHSITAAGLLGGGHPPKPGEISLAHESVLFLDELTEFKRPVIEALREPLETGRITLSRGALRETYPARFLLVAAMNPCPCGHLGDPSRNCRCTPAQIRRYQARLSGPLLERFDLGVEMIREHAHALSSPTAETPENTATIAARVLAAHTHQTARQGCHNAHLPAARFEHCLSLTLPARQLLNQVAERFAWSVRSQHKCLRLARTIADLAGSPCIEAPHLAEAVALRRPLDHLHLAEAA